MPRKLLAANWKENPLTEAQALRLFKATAAVKRGVNLEVAVCSPFIYVEALALAFNKLKNKTRFALGAQDVFWEEEGPFTSEVGPKMLKKLGARYAIVGHSERRKWLKETDEMINRKISLALADGLDVILCVGEPLSVRRKGLAAARSFVRKQLALDLKKVRSKKPGSGNIVIAYEPVWAIGTGRYDEPADAEAMAAFIKAESRKRIGMVPRVLYGGSVNQKNVADYVRSKKIDGALVGGASLKALEFGKMISIISTLK